MKPLQTFLAILTLGVGLYVLSMVFAKPAIKVAPQTAATSDAVGEGDEPPEKTDFFEANPFKLDAKASSKPKVELPEDQYDFGRLSLGATGEHDFVVKNVGTTTLKLARGPAQCKCTLSGLKEQEVPPGGETKIHLEWTPKDGGPFSQNATIWTNDPDQPKLTIGVSGEMFPEVVVMPTNGWTLGAFSNDNDVPLTGAIYSSVIKEFKITSIEPNSDQLTLEAIAMTPEQLQEVDALSGYQLKGHLKGQKEPVTISSKIVIHTDIEKHTKFELDVTGSRTGAITIIGPNWFAGQRVFELGVVDPEKGKDFRYTIFVSPAEEPLKFISVKSNPGFIKVTLEPKQTGENLAREVYQMVISVPPGSPKGLWSTANQGHLVLESNHPQVGTMELNVRLQTE